MKSSLTAGSPGIQEVRPSDHHYPERVREVPGRARVLRYAGNFDLLNAGPALAVVGTRTPEEDVVRATNRLVEVAGEFDMVIVSGLSPGVDVAAHEAALEHGLPTIAIPGGGLETVLDSDRGELLRRIVEAGGLVLSPFRDSEDETVERRFWRNRIIAAVCHGLVLVASEPEGGAWEAHRWARQLERRIIEPAELTPEEASKN